MIVTPTVQSQSYCSDNGYDYIPRAQHTVEWFVNNTTYRMCMYPGMPDWYDGGRWVGWNYFSSGNQIEMYESGGYALVRTRNPSYAPGHQTLANFLTLHPRWYYVESAGENIDRNSTWVCVRPPYVPGSGGSGGGSGGSGGGTNDNVQRF